MEDGDYIGVCPEASAYVLVTSNTTWKDAEWNLEDILNLAKGNDALEGLFTDDEKLSALKNPDMLLSYSNITALINWEKVRVVLKQKYLRKSCKQQRDWGYSCIWMRKNRT